VSVNPTPGEPTETTVVLNRRGEFDWQNTIVLSDSNRLTAGLTAERDQTRNNGFGDIHHQENSLAFFCGGRVDAGNRRFPHGWSAERRP